MRFPKNTVTRMFLLSYHPGNWYGFVNISGFVPHWTAKSRHHQIFTRSFPRLQQSTGFFFTILCAFLLKTAENIYVLWFAFQHPGIRALYPGCQLVFETSTSSRESLFGRKMFPYLCPTNLSATAAIIAPATYVRQRRNLPRHRLTASPKVHPRQLLLPDTILLTSGSCGPALDCTIWLAHNLTISRSLNPCWRSDEPPQNIRNGLPYSEQLSNST